MDLLQLILRYLRFQGVGLRAPLRVLAWQTLAARLHGWDPQRPKARVYEALEGGDDACWLQPRGPLLWGQLPRIKQEPRDLFPGRQAVVKLDGVPWRLRATTVHAPEPGDEGREWGLLTAAAAWDKATLKWEGWLLGPHKA